MVVTMPSCRCVDGPAVGDPVVFVVFVEFVAIVLVALTVPIVPIVLVALAIIPMPGVFRALSILFASPVSEVARKFHRR
ncbi:hypothetical protein DF200_02720 [Bifidobacterium catulorum]|uniref:Uncharacterized protein n=1 Tax=Bifidobacterium catulorum TaxID=1630173 RepID=A0A2U2MTY1_9BIFI|nr:hypothetical protein DF200_02720 [Bifidobacterium catulorum]